MRKDNFLNLLNICIDRSDVAGFFKIWNAYPNLTDLYMKECDAMIKEDIAPPMTEEEVQKNYDRFIKKYFAY